MDSQETAGSFSKNEREAVRHLSRINIRMTLVFLAALLLVAVAGALLYARSIDSQYDRAREQADLVRSRIQPEEGGQPQLADLPQLTADLNQLEEELRDLDQRVDLPVIGGIARNTPYLGDRVKASQQMLDLGIELTTISRDASQIGNELRQAFVANGFTASQPTVGATWLEVVDARRDDIYDLERRYSEAVLMRETLDVEHLPGRALNTLDTLDGLLARATEVRDDYFHLFPLLNAAFGAQEEARYLVLLQNGQELRQSGGFVGTYAAITVSNGRISELEINPVGELNVAYMNARKTVLPAPGPLREYLKQEEWFPHDANWSADFPEVAVDLGAMYADIGWPPLQGIVAVNDSVVADVLDIIGPYEVEIEGELQRVDAESFLDLIQSYRSAGTHKEVVGILGGSLTERVGATDFDTKKEIFFGLRDAAGRREIQVAMRDPAMQAEVVARGWDGAIYPDPEIPTLAMAVANVTGNKASENVFANTRLELTADASDTPVHARWTITFDHQGDPDGNLDYHGFHRTWAQIYLPPGAQLTSTSQEPEPAEIVGDDRALGFHIELLTGEQETLELEFDLPPEAGRLLLRRQSGMNDVWYELSVATIGCQLSEPFTLTGDAVVDLGNCAAQLYGE